MLWAMLAYFFLGGTTTGGAMVTADGVEGLRRQAATIVDDENRAALARETFGEILGVVKQFENGFKSSGKSFRKGYLDYDTDVAELRDILENMNGDWEQAQEQVLDLRFTLKDTLTEEEWAALFPR